MLLSELSIVHQPNALSITINIIKTIISKPKSNTNLVKIGEGITLVSSKKGFNAIQNLVTDSHQVRIRHPNYTTKSVSFYIIDGETKELVIALEPV